MPLRDDFGVHWQERRPWQGFGAAWTCALAFHLKRGVLPTEYYALPLVQVPGRVEVDVATYREGENPAAATAPTWAPPQPTLTLLMDLVETDTFEVQILRNFGGPQLRAAIELVSPVSKDRPSARRAFAGKCANHLNHGVSVIVIDIVTERTANLHGEILAALGRLETPIWSSPTQLYAIAYHQQWRQEIRELQAGPTRYNSGPACPSYRSGSNPICVCRYGWKRATWSPAVRSACESGSVYQLIANSDQGCTFAGCPNQSPHQLRSL